MASWLLSSLAPPTGIWNHITGQKTKSEEKWVGPPEAIVALAYKRFRPGAKLNITSFRITNDRSHPFPVISPWGEYNFDWQSVKRTILGGKGADMYNLKNPIYYSYVFLNYLPKEKAKLLLELALQSVEGMIDSTYAQDQVALECLHMIKTILTISFESRCSEPTITSSSSEDENDNELDKYADIRHNFRISDNYLNNPLTVKNIEIWKSHLNWLETICDELEEARDKSTQGGDFECNLANVKVILEKISDEMMVYYNKIIKGK